MNFFSKTNIVSTCLSALLLGGAVLAENRLSIKNGIAAELEIRGGVDYRDSFDGACETAGFTIAHNNTWADDLTWNGETPSKISASAFEGGRKKLGCLDFIRSQGDNYDLGAFEVVQCPPNSTYGANKCQVKPVGNGNDNPACGLPQRRLAENGISIDGTNANLEIQGGVEYRNSYGHLCDTVGFTVEPGKMWTDGPHQRDAHTCGPSKISASLFESGNKKDGCLDLIYNDNFESHLGVYEVVQCPSNSTYANKCQVKLQGGKNNPNCNNSQRRLGAPKLS